MGNVSRITSEAAGPGARKPARAAIFFQIMGIILSAPAAAWGVFVVFSTAFPPKCGDWSGFTPLGVLESWFVDLPIGLLVLAVAIFARKGSRSLRRACTYSSILVLSLPVVASILLSRWHCP